MIFCNIMDLNTGTQLGYRLLSFLLATGSFIRNVNTTAGRTGAVGPDPELNLTFALNWGSGLKK
jgi:hypothetical protein